MAFILEALTPAVRQALRTAWTGPSEVDQPSSDELIDTLADLLERSLTPPDADLAAAKSVLLDELQQAVDAGTARISPSTPG